MRSQQRAKKRKNEYQRERERKREKPEREKKRPPVRKLTTKRSEGRQRKGSAVNTSHIKEGNEGAAQKGVG